MINPVLNIDGLLWAEYDTDRPLKEIVKDIRRAHRRRLGCSPNLIMVHPDLIPIETMCISIRLIPQRETLPHHYFAIRIPSSQGAD